MGKRDDIWVTRDGRHIRVEHLDDAHLANIIAMLQRGGIEDERVGQVELYLRAGRPAGEQARAAFDEEAAAVLMGIPLRLFVLSGYRPIYASLKWEAARRKREAAEIAAGRANLGGELVARTTRG